MKNPKFLFFIGILMCLCSPLYAQQHTSKQIDSLYTAAEIERSKGNLQEYLKKHLSNLQESQKINYSKGIALSHYGAGIALYGLGKCDEAIEHFTRSEKEAYTKTDLSLQSETNRFLGDCYLKLGLYNQAIPKFRKAIAIAEKANNENLYICKSMNYNDIGACFDAKKDVEDSVYYYYNKAFYYIQLCIAHSKKISKANKYGIAVLLASNLGEVWDSRNNPDSANYYFQKALEFNKNTKNIPAEISIYDQMANSFLKNKKYAKAIDYFEKIIQLAGESNDLYKLRNGYKGISEAYKNSGNEKKYLEYTPLYIKISDSISVLEKKGLDQSVNKIIGEERTIQKKSKAKFYRIIGGIFLLAVLMSLTAYLLHQKMKRKKERELTERDQIIIKKDQEAQELSMKLNTAFDEVVQLAKTNNPEFFTRFQEVYPEFNNKLLMINPDLVNSELRFCALLFFNFSTKDIAEFTFTSPRTVQHRKYTLRKKLNIPSDQDLYMWFKNLF